MLIFYDCTFAQPTGHTAINGGGEYAVRLFSALTKHSSFTKHEFILLTSCDRGENRIIMNFCTNNVRIYRYNSIKDLEHLIKSQRPARIIFPVLYPEYGKLKIDEGTEIIGIIHDMSTFFYAKLGKQPGRYSKHDVFDWVRKIYGQIFQKYIMNESLKLHSNLFKMNSTTYIYTVSYYTQSTLEYYLHEIGMTQVFYSPLKEIKQISSEEEKKILDRYNLEKQSFFLLSSVNRWSKNNVRVIQALDRMFSNIYLCKLLDNYKIVLVGVDYTIDRYLRKLKNIDKFIAMPYVSESEMEVLYKNAYAYIYPSLFEGFGYPPIEAMRYETVSLCSVYASIPEVCGDAVIYFNPIDIDSISLAIMRSLNKEYYSMVRKKIALHYEKLRNKQKEDMEDLIIILTKGW